MSFLLDPPLLIGAGAVIEKLPLREGAARGLSRGTVALFVGGSLALYANAPGLHSVWGRFGARSGREFMLTSGLAPVDEVSMLPAQHLAALSLFLAYPMWLALGRRLAKRRAAPDGVS